MIPVAHPLLPPGFRFGASTAAHQTEGGATDDGKGPSIWDTFSHLPEKIADGSTGDVACGHYHRLYEALDRMPRSGIRRPGLRAYRFAISFARILPEGSDHPNAAGLDFYERLIDGLLERDIQPM